MTVNLKNKKTIIIGIMLIAFIISIISAVVVLSADVLNIHLDGEQVQYNSDEAYYYVTLPAVSKGIYDISIDYSSTEDAQTEITTSLVSHNTVLSDNPVLQAGDNNSKDYSFWINNKVENVTVKILGNQGAVNIKTIDVKTSWNSKLNQVIVILLRLLLLCGVCIVIYKFNSIRKYTFEVIGIGSITLFSSFGAFLRYILPGHDLAFHLLRIEGLKDALMLGDIPCKIQTNWCNGWGYAVSAIYGDISILLPSIMRLCGFTLQTSYHTFIFFVNLLTAVSAYYCFLKISNNKKISMITAFLYTTAPYRLCNIYIRGAFGEYTAMIFFPMLILGLWYVFYEETESESFGKRLLIPVIGITGLIQTHMLSCLMCALFVILFLVIEYKRVFKAKRIKYGLKICLASLLVNLGFLIPLFTFLKEPLRISSSNYHPADYQWYGLSLPEIFAQNPSGSMNYNWAFLTSLSDRMSMAVGNGFVIYILAYLYFVLTGKIKNTKKGSYVSLILGIVALYMSSNLFPYSAIKLHFPKLFDLLTRVNVPYRYITIAILCFSIFVAATGKDMISSINKSRAQILVVSMVLIAFLQSSNYLYSYIYNGGIANYYDAVNINTNNIMGGEYLYEGVDENAPFYGTGIEGNNCSVLSESHRANRYEVEVSASGDNSFVELPLYYYPGYVAKDADGDYLSVERGNNGKIKVLFDGDYNGIINVRYKEPVLWRFFEIVSLISFILLILYKRFNKSAA